MTETAAMSSTVMVTGMVVGRQTRMLVDTGSVVTILREDVWRESQEPNQCTPIPPFRPVVTANGQELDLLGQSEVLIHVGGLREKHTALIAKGLTQECLLGVDFLKRHGCIVDLHL